VLRGHRVDLASLQVVGGDAPLPSPFLHASYVPHSQRRSTPPRCGHGAIAPWVHDDAAAPACVPWGVDTRQPLPEFDMCRAQVAPPETLGERFGIPLGPALRIHEVAVSACTVMPALQIISVVENLYQLCCMRGNGLIKPARALARCSRAGGRRIWPSWSVPGCIDGRARGGRSTPVGAGLRGVRGGVGAGRSGATRRTGRRWTGSSGPSRWGSAAQCVLRPARRRRRRTPSCGPSTA
jgi:hypothetical protein